MALLLCLLVAPGRRSALCIPGVLCHRRTTQRPSDSRAPSRPGERGLRPGRAVAPLGNPGEQQAIDRAADLTRRKPRRKDRPLLFFFFSFENFITTGRQHMAITVLSGSRGVCVTHLNSLYFLRSPL